MRCLIDRIAEGSALANSIQFDSDFVVDRASDWLRDETGRRRSPREAPALATSSSSFQICDFEPRGDCRRRCSHGRDGGISETGGSTLNATTPAINICDVGDGVNPTVPAVGT
jgi:hypothetical protein